MKNLEPFQPSLQSNKINDYEKCKITGFLGNFHGFDLKKTLSISKNKSVYQLINNYRSREIYKPLNSPAPVLQRGNTGLAFKKLGKITLVGKV